MISTPQGLPLVCAHVGICLASAGGVLASAIHVVPFGGAVQVVKAEPRWTVRTIDGQALQGTARTDTRDEVLGVTVTSDGQPPVWIPLDQVLEFDRSSTQSSAVPVALAEIRLRSGSLVRAASLGGSPEEALRVTLVGDDEVSVDLALHHIAAMRLVRESQPEPLTFLADLATPPGAADYLFVDDKGVARRFSVAIRKVQGAALAFDFADTARTVPLERVLGIVFGDATGLAPDPQPGVRVRVQTRGGSQLSGRLIEITDTIALVLDEGTELRLPVASVEGIAVASDRLVMLSMMDPSDVQQTPAMDRVWPWLRDRSYDPDGIIQLGGERHARGLVLVPRTRLTYAIDKPFDRFEATVGIEDDAGQAAHAICRVLVDGKVVWERTFGRSTPPEALSLSIQGAKEIALEADFGARFDLCDYCVFGSPRLLR